MNPVVCYSWVEPLTGSYSPPQLSEQPPLRLMEFGAIKTTIHALVLDPQRVPLFHIDNLPRIHCLVGPAASTGCAHGVERPGHVGGHAPGRQRAKPALPVPQDSRGRDGSMERLADGRAGGRLGGRESIDVGGRPHPSCCPSVHKSLGTLFQGIVPSAAWRGPDPSLPSQSLPAPACARTFVRRTRPA